MTCDPPLQSLQALFDKWGIDHFSAVETIRLKNPEWTGERVCVPRPSLRENIRKTIELADVIRDQWGGPVRVLSGYRPSAYNQLVGGASQSQHLRYKALDLQPHDGRVEEFTELVRGIVAGARDCGLNVGLGLYRSFVHIDTDATTGINREWDKRS